MKSTKSLLFLILISVILMGCLPKQNSVSSNLVTATLQIKDSGLPSTMIATSTKSSPSTSTTVFAPTLFPEANESYLLLQKYLKNEPPCQLPCWGGITPGLSTAPAAEKALTNLRIISSPSFTYFGQLENDWYIGSLNIFYPLLNTQVNVAPGFVSASDSMTVVYINIYSQSLPYQNSAGQYYGDKEYNALLSAYTLPQIFTTHGLPNLIYTRADIYPSKLFFIRLLYLDLGIFISYEMPMEEKVDIFLFCPSKSLITLDLTSQHIGEGYQDFFQQFGDGVWTTLKRTHHKLLDDAIGMTNKEFSQEIISSPESCFETPIDIWPEP